MRGITSGRLGFGVLLVACVGFSTGCHVIIDSVQSLDRAFTGPAPAPPSPSMAERRAAYWNTDYPDRWVYTSPHGPKWYHTTTRCPYAGHNAPKVLMSHARNIGYSRCHLCQD